MIANSTRGLRPSRPEARSAKKGNKRTLLLAAGSADQLSYWKDWREGNFDLALLGSWPNESLTRPNES
jgi:hypothetical protein